MQIKRAPPSAAPGRILESETFAFAVLAISLILTLVFWYFSAESFAHRGRDRFLYLAEKEKLTLLSRMQAYEQVLRGGAALFAASGTVSRAEWRTYIAHLGLDLALPGIQGTGFARVLAPAEVAAHQARMQSEGFADYTIRPPGPRAIYSSIDYIEPFNERNRRAIGYDMFSEPIRRAAMERARDTGLPSTTGKVTLVQESDSDVQPGFLIYLPVYRNDLPQTNIDERRAALIGFVYSPFRAHDLMQNIAGSFDQDTAIEIYDGAVAPANLLFSSTTDTRTARYNTESTIEIGGRIWTLHFHSHPEFEEITASVQPQIILFGGMALNFLLFIVMYTNARHRQRMRRAARKLEQSRDRYRTLVENVPGTVFRSKPAEPWRFDHVSHGIETLTGHSAESFMAGKVTLKQLIHPDDIERVNQAVGDALRDRQPYDIEYRICDSHDQIRWAAERGRATHDDNGGQWIDGVILDVTDRKIAENAIRNLAFYDPLTSLPNRRLLLDRMGQALANSERSGRHGAVLFVDLDNFKALNDSYGHEAGDVLLREVAARLRESVREGDTVARLGGDEFVIMLVNLGTTRTEASAQATQVARKILAALNAPYQIGGYRHSSTPSVGITTFFATGRNPDQLIKDADVAMYRAKAAGRNTFSVFEPTGAE